MTDHRRLGFTGDTLRFQALDYHDYHDQSQDPEEYVILVFGRTAEDQDVCLKLTDYHPFFYLQVSERLSDDQWEEYLQRAQSKVSWMCEREEMEEDLGQTLLAHSWHRRVPFMGFCAGQTRRYAKLEFSSLRGMRLWSRALQKPLRIRRQTVRGIPCESNMDPYIRAIHARDLVACGWMEVSRADLHRNSRYSRCDISVSANWEAVRPSPRQGEMAPWKILGYDIECASSDRGFPQASRRGDPVIQVGLTQYRLGSLDCERQWMLNLGPCDPIDNCQLTCYDTEPELLLGYARLVAEIRPDIMAGHNTFGFDDRYICERLDFHDRLEARRQGVELEELENSLLFQFCQIYGKLNNARIADRECLTESLTSYRRQALSSSAMGQNNLYYFRAPGIVPIDTYKYLRREYSTLDNYTLDSVASVFISEKVTGVEEDSDGIWIRTNNARGLLVGAYVQILVNHGYFNMPLEESKYRVLDLRGSGRQTEILVQVPEESRAAILAGLREHKTLWAFAKDDMPPTQISDHWYAQNAAGMAQVGRYCLQDCQLVNLLLEKLLTVIGSITMANVCSVPLYYIFVRGQGPKNMSLVLKYTTEAGFVLPVLPKLEHAPKYQGAVVIDPKPGIYEATISVLDYKSLYPSSMRQKNVSHDAHVADPRYLDLPGYLYHQVSMDTLDEDRKCIYKDTGEVLQTEYTFAQEIVTREQIEEEMAETWARLEEEYSVYYPKRGHRMTERDVAAWRGTEYGVGERLGRAAVAELRQVYEDKLRWAQKAEEKKNYNFTQGVWVRYAIIPKILGILLMERETTKKKMAIEADPFQKALLDARQQALKVTANSIYGLSGARTSKIYYLPVASSTTAIGRDMLYLAERLTLELYPEARIVYGDTDSIFVDWNIRDAEGRPLKGDAEREEAIRRARATEAYINGRIDSPQEIEYEKSFSPFIVVTKKKYVGIRYMADDPPGTPGTMAAMGMILRRRDNAPITKKVFSELINYILYQGDAQGGVNHVYGLLQSVLRGEYGLPHFVVRKALRAEYKKPQSIAHKVLAERMAARDPGNAPKSNDRIPYAHYRVPATKELKAKTGERIETPEFIVQQGLQLDYMYYIDHQMKKPVSQILELVMEKRKVEAIFNRLRAIDHGSKFCRSDAQSWLTEAPEIDLQVGRTPQLWQPERDSWRRWVC